MHDSGAGSHGVMCRALYGSFSATEGALTIEAETMCDAMQGERKHLPPDADDETFRLHLAFLHAHGAPKGQLTTFSRSGTMTVNGENAGRVESRS